MDTQQVLGLVKAVLDMLGLTGVVTAAVVLAVAVSFLRNLLDRR